MKPIDVNKFGQLKLLMFLEKSKGHSIWLVRCDCGAFKHVRYTSLLTGNTKSCGCLNKIKHTKHGHASSVVTRTYRSWDSMKARCRNTKDKYYGGRGITFCKRWNSFNNFLEDMGIRPQGTSLDRINNTGNYEPSNCRWATPKQQNNNQSKRRKP
jgi:hypothetical protein